MDAYRARSALDERLVEAVLDWGDAVMHRAGMRAAMEVFFGERPEDSEAGDVVRFHAWLLHDFPTGGHPSVLDRYLAERGGDLRPDERAHLEGRRASRPGLYEVARVRRGLGEDLVDVLTGERFDVMDVRGSWQLSSWDVLWGRLTRFGPDWTSDGAPLRFPAAERDDVAAMVRRHWEVYGSSVPGAGASDALRARSAEIDRELRAFGEGRAFETVTREGDPIVFSRASYRLTDAPSAAERLAAVAALHSEEPQEAGELVAFSWLQRKSTIPQAPLGEGPASTHRFLLETGPVNRPGPPMLHMGSVGVHAERLELECVSRPRLSRLRRIVEDALGGLATFEREEFETADAAMGRLPESPEETLPPTPLPPSVRRRFREDWLRRPVPALRGRSPLEAARTKEGKAQVQDLLKVLVNAAERQEDPIFDSRAVEGLARRLGVALPGSEPTRPRGRGAG